MHILLIDESFGADLSKDGINHMWIEIDDDGFIERELGFNEKNEIVHRYPGCGRFGQYGVFDMNKFDTSSLGEEDITPEEFEKAWQNQSMV